MKSKLSEEEKEKVRDVRRQGACLRCRMLKIQCSRENPCLPCLSSALRGYERKVLSFCYCVRTKFADVNIFSSAGDAPSSSSSRAGDVHSSAITSLLASVADPEDFSLATETFNKTMISWLTDPGFSLPSGSMVMLLCSSILSVSEPDHIDRDLIACFRSFLLATSMAYNRWNGTGPAPLTHQDLCRASLSPGSKIITQLDRMLTPQNIARCDVSSCQMLFLLVLGIAIGVGYSTDMTESPGFRDETDPQFQQSPTLWLTMRDHLCQMLAHHLVYIGSVLGIKLETAVERCIIDGAAERWNKIGSYVWAQAERGPHDRGATPSRETRAWAKSAETAPPSAGAPFVAIPCPDMAVLHNSDAEWENPESYLSMAEDVPEVATRDINGPSVPDVRDWFQTGMFTQQRPRRDPFPEPPIYGVPEPMVKRRSVWIVRPVEDDGLVNVHARYRMKHGESIGCFV